MKINDDYFGEYTNFSGIFFVMSHRKTYIRRQFDFDIGYLVKSPCRNCDLRFDFPGCMERCDTLDLIQTQLARGVSSCRSHSPMEAFRVDLESWRNK